MTENDRSNEHQPQWKRANQLTDVTVPIDGTSNGSFYVSGSSPLIVGPLLRYGLLHQIISAQDFHAESTTDLTYSASISSSFGVAETPYFHRPISGASEYVSIAVHNPTELSTIEVWITVAEPADT